MITNDTQYDNDVNTNELDLDGIFEHIKNIGQEWMQANATLMTGEQKKLPGMLDRKALEGQVFYGNNFIAVSGSTRHIDYYGGFEYIDGDDKLTLGNYTLYLADSESRVQDVLDTINSNTEQSDSDE